MIAATGLEQYRTVDLPEAAIREASVDGTYIARWIGVTPPPYDGPEGVHVAEHVTAHYAVTFAEAVIGGEDEWGLLYRREDYVLARDRAALLRSICDRMAASGRLAGAIVDRRSLDAEPEVAG